MRYFFLLLLILVIPLSSCTQGADAYFLQGLSRYKLGDHRGAIEDYNQAIQLDPKLGEAYVLRGLSKIQLNQKNSGCLDLSKAGELGDASTYGFIRLFCN
jgi:tetratricopeptide (TPR) repeat protein